MRETRAEAIITRTQYCTKCVYRAKVRYHNQDYLYCWKKKKMAIQMSIYDHCTDRKEVN